MSHASWLLQGCSALVLYYLYWDFLPNYHIAFGSFQSMPLWNIKIIPGKQLITCYKFINGAKILGNYLSRSLWIFNILAFQCLSFTFYIHYSFQSAPISILEKHELASMTLEYRKECGRDSVLQSLTTVSSSADCTGEDGVRCEHLLQLESGAEIVKGWTEWRPKRIGGEENVGAIWGQSA